MSHWSSGYLKEVLGSPEDNCSGVFEEVLIVKGFCLGLGRFWDPGRTLICQSDS